MGNPTKFQEQEVNHDNYKAMERGAGVVRTFRNVAVAAAIGGVGVVTGTVTKVIPKVARATKEVLPKVSASIFKAKK